MEKTTYHFIVNGNAGKGKKNIWKSKISPELKSRDIDYKAYMCEAKGHATKLVAKLMDTYQQELTIIIVGGDGTFNEALNGITDFSRVTLGHIPVGSANDLAFGLGISKDPIVALNRILVDGATLPMDIGKATILKSAISGEEKSHLFAISSGLGVDAAACETSNESTLKKVLNKLGIGKLIYAINAVRLLFSHPMVDASIAYTDDEGQAVIKEIDGLVFVAAMNHPYEGGGIAMANNADCRDGKLSFALVSGYDGFKALYNIALLMGKKLDKVANYECLDLDGCTVTLKDSRVLHTDGETWGKVNEVSFECLHEAIKIIV